MPKYIDADLLAEKVNQYCHEYGRRTVPDFVIFRLIAEIQDADAPEVKHFEETKVRNNDAEIR